MKILTKTAILITLFLLSITAYGWRTEGNILIIEKGDNLWEIAHSLFGQGWKYDSLWDINNKRFISLTQDPNLIYAGMRLQLPNRVIEKYDSIPGIDSLNVYINFTNKLETKETEGFSKTFNLVLKILLALIPLLLPYILRKKIGKQEPVLTIGWIIISVIIVVFLSLTIFKSDTSSNSSNEKGIEYRTTNKLLSSSDTVYHYYLNTCSNVDSIGSNKDYTISTIPKSESKAFVFTTPMLFILCLFVYLILISYLFREKILDDRKSKEYYKEKQDYIRELISQIYKLERKIDPQLEGEQENYEKLLKNFKGNIKSKGYIFFDKYKMYYLNKVLLTYQLENHNLYDTKLKDARNIFETLRSLILQNPNFLKTDNYYSIFKRNSYPGYIPRYKHRFSTKSEDFDLPPEFRIK